MRFVSDSTFFIISIMVKAITDDYQMDCKGCLYSVIFGSMLSLLASKMLISNCVAAYFFKCQKGA